MEIQWKTKGNLRETKGKPKENPEENQKETNEKPMENHWKTAEKQNKITGKPWAENHVKIKGNRRKTMDPYENHEKQRKTIGKPQENQGKTKR